MKYARFFCVGSLLSRVDNTKDDIIILNEIIIVPSNGLTVFNIISNLIVQHTQNYEYEVKLEIQAIPPPNQPVFIGMQNIKSGGGLTGGQNNSTTMTFEVANNGEGNRSIKGCFRVNPNVERIRMVGKMVAWSGNADDITAGSNNNELVLDALSNITLAYKNE